MILEEILIGGREWGLQFTHHKRDQKAQFFMSVMVQKLNNGNIFAGNLSICGVCVCVMTVSSLRPQLLSPLFIIFKWILLEIVESDLQLLAFNLRMCVWIGYLNWIVNDIGLSWNFACIISICWYERYVIMVNLVFGKILI